MDHSKCFHCGQNDLAEEVFFNNKTFCCQGCRIVYEILHMHGLDKFYKLNPNPGISPNTKYGNRFDCLDHPEIREKLIDFDDENLTLIRFFIPSMHCSSCIWLLESLSRINPHIVQSTVDFTRKTLQVGFKHAQCSLRKLAQFLTQLGYQPVINLQSLDKEKESYDREVIYKLAVSFFCFGNIMLLAFPEYIGAEGDVWLLDHQNFFRWLMLILSLPVMLFPATGYFRSAYAGLKHGFINIDVSISLGILVLFLRSAYEVIFELGPGYFDSLTGLVFFLLTGRYFQMRTYRALSFDRDYKSFYPIAITRIRGRDEENILLAHLKKGDRILMHNEEIIPVDAVLIRGVAMIDNSFITGESRLIPKKSGDRIYAGGKQKGEAIELEVIKEVDQSYLTQLWTHDAFRKKGSSMDTMVNRWSHYFTLVVLVLALITGLFWCFIDPSKALQTVCAVLIVACPCALALSTPFTLGNVMRILARKGCFVRDIHTIERTAKVQSLVFDKTGTITESEGVEITFVGDPLTDIQQQNIASLLKHSNHPLSRMLYKQLNTGRHDPISYFREIPGKGLEALIGKIWIKAGSADYVKGLGDTHEQQSKVFVSLRGYVPGYFLFRNRYRKGLKKLFQALAGYKLSILSGDNDSEKTHLQLILPTDSQLFFNQNPKGKLYYIKNLQIQGERVMMFGDGLNDAGALKQSDVGVVISENINSFSPHCDVLMDAKSFDRIPHFLRLSQISVKCIQVSFIISLLYNVIGLAFAVSGRLKPVVAAVLMPLSSISVVAFAMFSTWVGAYRQRMV
ncbi:MAG: heavy metal translocating P-type ATPase metal-binding domain-containing protein [Flavobacteriales bacterium]